MIEILLQYGVFLAKTLTVVAAVVLGTAFLVEMLKRDDEDRRLDVRSLNKRYQQLEHELTRETLPAAIRKSRMKELEKAAKARDKDPGQTTGKRVFVLEFRGDIRAASVSSLREEITAVLTLATEDDEVLVRLENSGGLVHEHGLAASQLLRIRDRGIPLTVAVDKVAASGGYLMASAGNRILAAPFAILGSIGVLLALPNFHKLMDQHGIDFEMIKSVQHKRTLTLFGENTEPDREKAREEVGEIHSLLKEYIAKYRPQLDIDRVATGEHWYGARALELALCDELTTSDDYLMAASKDAEVFSLRVVRRKPLRRRVTGALESLYSRLFVRGWRAGQEAA